MVTLPWIKVTSKLVYQHIMQEGLLVIFVLEWIYRDCSVALPEIEDFLNYLKA